MLERLRFYLRHSLNDLKVNKRLTFFALLSIAAGVGAIVSLQTLSVMITDTLTGNLQELNRGDIVVTTRDGGPGVEDLTTNFFGGEVHEPRFNATGLANFQDWFDEDQPGVLTAMTARYSLTTLLGVFTSTGTGTLLSAENGNIATKITPILIDSAVYPLYGEIRAEGGDLLGDLLDAPTAVVLSRNTAELLDVEPGETVRLSGADAEFTVRGIVPIDAEVKTFGADMFAGIFGYYYLDQSALELFEGVRPLADKVFFRLSDPAQTGMIENIFSRHFNRIVQTTSTEDLREQNEVIAEGVSQLTTIMGLISLLIGSIGIVNTMQVIVRRRTLEVAVLKTLGLQANQVTLLFLTEAFVMGIVGSLAGVLLGWLAALLLKGVAETFTPGALPFAPHLGPAINGFVVGVLVTTVFGFLPTLTAGQVRPGIVLRPSDTIRLRAGWWRTLLALLVIVVALAFIANTILNNFVTALIVVGSAFLAAGILYVLLLFLIWLIGRLLPSFGLVDLKVALRQMMVGRGRGATTLLALVVGVFSLSLITLFAGAVTTLLNSMLAEINGNIIISAIIPAALEEVQDILADQEGLTSYQVANMYNVTLSGVQDTDGNDIRLAVLHDRVRNSDIATPPYISSEREQQDWRQRSFDRALDSLDGVTLDLPPQESLLAGRSLTAADQGQRVMVITDSAEFSAAGFGVGYRLTLRFRSGEEVTYEVVGVRKRSILGADASIPGQGTLTVPSGTIPAGNSSQLTTMLVDIEDAYVPAFRRELTRVPGVFALEFDILTQLINSLLGTFTTFPSLVAALGLVVGGVVIANSVALSTMERRREIAIMKAVGLQRGRVLGMLLLENGILGLIGGLIGVGIGLAGLALALTTTTLPGAYTAIPYGTALVLMLLCIGVALLAALTSAWDASGEKPLNVLRYE